jgi:hypothetical protein
MASSSVKRNVDCTADSSDLQISKINIFVFGAVMKTTDSWFLLIILKGNMRNMTSEW